MPPSTQNAVALIGRTLLAMLFVVAGYTKVGDFAGTVAYIAARELPAAQVIAALTIALELGAGLAVVVGFRARWAALVLAFFSVAAAVIFHNFWMAPPDRQMTEYLMFMKDIAISGGLLTIAAFGPGAWSWDERRNKAMPALRTARL
jgi:putative oxidoreductase